MKKKKPKQSKNVWHEASRRRGCRAGLIGVMVRRPNGQVWGVWGSGWDRHSRLVLDFSDGTSELAMDCELESEWPVKCCRPRGPVEDPAQGGKPAVRRKFS
jgi:hypothetical protein